jgi:DNA-binding XRE family transcriptional regulator
MVSASQEYLERVKTLMKERRIALSLTQKDAAERSGVNLRTLQHFEQTGEINFEKLLKLFVLYRMDKRVMMHIEDRSWWTVEELERSETKSKVRK